VNPLIVVVVVIGSVVTLIEFYNIISKIIALESIDRKF